MRMGCRQVTNAAPEPGLPPLGSVRAIGSPRWATGSGKLRDPRCVLGSGRGSNCCRWWVVLRVLAKFGVWVGGRGCRLAAVRRCRDGGSPVGGRRAGRLMWVWHALLPESGVVGWRAAHGLAACAGLRGWPPRRSALGRRRGRRGCCCPCDQVEYGSGDVREAGGVSRRSRSESLWAARGWAGFGFGRR